MPEAGGPAQHGQLPGKAKEPPEHASGDNEPSSSETQPSTTDPARAAALKARKRTKTGCLSKSCPPFRFRSSTVDIVQRVEKDGSSAARSALPARTASSPSANAKVIFLE